MPSMNIGLQRRVGALPKTPEIETPMRSGYYGYSHAGYSGRRPTPRYEGFFGIGSGWYGDDEMAQGDLPVNGFYGATAQEDDVVEAYLNGHYLQLGEAEAAASEDATVGTQATMSSQVTASEGFVLSNNALMIGAGLALIMLLRK